MNEVDIPSPNSDDTVLTSLNVATGERISKLDRLSIFDAGSWEDLTLELVSHWKTQYSRVLRCGAGGDMGRDVIAYHHEDPSTWENYQCKHYSSRLNLAKALLEIGKVIYYSFKGEFTFPSHYYFVTPHGVSNDLLNHLNDPEKLKKALLSRWDADCRSKITTKRAENIELTESLKTYIDGIDFSSFDHLPPIKIIELHSKTEFHVQRFGTDIRNRPQLESPPADISSEETIYTTELLSAFADAEGLSEFKRSSLVEGSEFDQEFKSARKNFYAAEGLEKFSRDWLPSNSYEELVEECYEAISATVRSEHANAYARYLATNVQATNVSYGSHPLSPYIKVQDKKGMCHQLVNAKRFRWVKAKF